MASFLRELSRRNVGRVGVAYLVAAWLVMQVVDVVNEPLSLPDWFPTAVILLLAIGLPIALVFSWAFELTPEGLKKSHEVPLAQSITRVTGSTLKRLSSATLPSNCKLSRNSTQPSARAADPSGDREQTASHTRG